MNLLNRQKERAKLTFYFRLFTSDRSLLRASFSFMGKESLFSFDIVILFIVMTVQRL